ncbi:MAG: DUF3592 domain-containing protein [Bryobacteraceae bacterium]
MKLAVLLGLGFFLVPGVLMMGIGSRNIWRGVSSSHWPEVKGVVTSSTNAAGVAVRYVMNGQEYSSGVIQFGQTSGSSDSAEAELLRLRYPAGSAVTLHVHPKDPSLAVVEPGFHSDSLWLPGAGLLFALSAILFGFMALGPERNFLGYGMGAFALIFVLIGLPMFAAGSLNLWRASVSRDWPVAPGVILSGKAHLDENVEVVPGEEEAAYGRGLVYRYEVAGKKWYSDIVAFGQTPDSSAGGDRFPYGAKVRVAYSPGNPGIAVLEPGITNSTYLLPGAGAAFLLFGLAVFFVAIPALSGK